jgi:hypothetical protein
MPEMFSSLISTLLSRTLSFSFGVLCAQIVSTTCVHVAGKVEETPKRITGAEKSTIAICAFPHLFLTSF